MLDKEGHIKLTDFGLSRLCSQSNEKAFTICGTPYYIAPEIFEKKGYNNTVDWWSLGCLMYEMLNGKPLFNFGNNRIIISEYKKKIIMPNNFSEEAKDLINKLLNLDPKKRLGAGKNGFENLKKHKYFEDVDWDDLEKKKITPPFIPNIDGDMDLKYFDKIFIDELNFTKEYDDLNNPNKTIDNYVNFSYYDPTSGSFREKENQNLIVSNSEETE